MDAGDIFLMALILGGAAFLLYRSIWKRRGRCHGCDGCGREKE